MTYSHRQTTHSHEQTTHSHESLVQWLAFMSKSLNEWFVSLIHTWHDSFTRMTCRIHMCTHDITWYDMITHVCLFACVQQTWALPVCHDSWKWMKRLQHIRIRDMTCFPVCNQQTFEKKSVYIKKAYIYISTCVYEKRPIKEWMYKRAYCSNKQSLYCKSAGKDLYIWKETHKRDLRMYEKRLMTGQTFQGANYSDDKGFECRSARNNVDISSVYLALTVRVCVSL